MTTPEPRMITIGIICALGGIVLGGGGVLLSEKSRTNRHDVALEAERTEALSVAVGGIVEPLLADLDARKSVTDASRQVECLDETMDIETVYSCTVAMQQEACDEAGVEAGERVADCSRLTIASEKLGRLIAADSLAVARVDHFRDYNAALAEFLQVLGQ